MIVVQLFCGSVTAGVFTTPQFVQPGRFAIGLEPELTLTNGAGLGFNARYTHGISDFNNLSVIAGTGMGPRQLRLGGSFSFDVIPDIEGQPGIGIALQGLFVRLRRSDQFELTGVPYLSKTFKSGESEFSPFLSFPIGYAFASGRYNLLATAVVGSSFKAGENFKYSLELGVAVQNIESYFSGGVSYFY